MAEHKINGTDMLLFISEDGVDYNTVICLTANGITRTTSEIDAKTKCGPDKLPGTQENAVTFEGQCMADPSGTTTSVADLVDYWTNKTTIYWKLAVAVPVTGDPVYTGTGFISKLDETYNQDTPGTFSGAIGVYGLANLSVTP
jgi:hypothetical protein